VRTRRGRDNFWGLVRDRMNRDEAGDAMIHSPRRTRSQTTVGTAIAEMSTSTPEAEVLRSILQEIGRLREEQKAEREATRAELRRLEQDITQLSHINNISVTRGETHAFENDSAARNEACVSGNDSVRAGFKFKPDTFDGSVPLREYLTQFDLIARINAWPDEVKAVALASSLRGKARAVLDGVSEVEDLKFEELRSRLELHFGEGHLAQTFYMQFINRKQKPLEELAALGADIERLSRLAYPECTKEIRDKVACAQFIAALSNGFIRRTLQLEGVSSLRTALERALAIKAILGNGSAEGDGKRNEFYKNKRKGNFSNKDHGNKEGAGKGFDGSQRERKTATKKECWQCGEQGHFRSECPTLADKGNAD